MMRAAKPKLSTYLLAMNTPSKLLAILAILATAGTADAQLIYDSFQSYSTGNLIGQAAGGTGLTNSWLNPTNNAGVTFTVENSGGMSYSGGAVSVNGGTQFGRASSTSIVTGNPTANIQLSSTLTPTTTYISFLMRFNGTLDLSDQFSLQFANANTDTSFLRSGVRDDSTAAPNDVAFVANNSTSSYPIPEVIVTSGTTYFALVKLDVSGANWSNATMWLNPTELTEAAQGTNGTAVRALSVNTAVNYLGFKFQNPDASDSFDLDEIRVGTTWDSVVVPEPSTWALLVGGLAALVAFRRRRN